jgi:hypothetical protein
MWILMIIAVHINNPEDIPAKVSFSFETKEQCEKIVTSLDYWVKFKDFKIEASCLKRK